DAVQPPGGAQALELAANRPIPRREVAVADSRETIPARRRPSNRDPHRQPPRATRGDRGENNACGVPKCVQTIGWHLFRTSGWHLTREKTGELAPNAGLAEQIVVARTFDGHESRALAEGLGQRLALARRNDRV